MMFFIQYSNNIFSSIDEINAFDCINQFKNYVNSLEIGTFISTNDRNNANNFFCNNFNNFIKKPKCIECRINQFFMYDTSKMIKVQPDYWQLYYKNLTKSIENQLQCQWQVCYSTELPVFNLTQSLHKSVDLREHNLLSQTKFTNQCASNFAVNSIHMLESLLLFDLKFNNAPFQQFNEIKYNFWLKERNTPKMFSTQTLLVNDFNNNMDAYCDYGASLFNINNLNYQNETMEYDLNRQYFPDNVGYMKSFLNKNKTDIKLQQEFYYLPFQVQKSYKNNSIGTPIILLHDFKMQDNKTFNSSVVQNIQILLNYGIPVSVKMNATSHELVARGENSIEFEDCDTSDLLQAQHDVQIVGYGKKNNMDVWVVKNTFGKFWAANGYFYVPRGINAYCLETYAFAVLPKFFNLQNNKQLNQSVLNNEFQQQRIQRNSSGVVGLLDFEDFDEEADIEEQTEKEESKDIQPETIIIISNKLLYILLPIGLILIILMGTLVGFKVQQVKRNKKARIVLSRLGSVQTQMEAIKQSGLGQYI